MLAIDERTLAEHTISIVVPVYQGEHTFDTLVEEICPLTKHCRTPQGRLMRVPEVLLVHDAGPDRSDVVVQRLVSTIPFIGPVRLSRNEVLERHPGSRTDIADVLKPVRHKSISPKDDQILIVADDSRYEGKDCEESPED